MKRINTYIAERLNITNNVISERLIISKTKKTPEITLEEFVRWYHSDKNSNYLVDIDELDEQDILEALDYPRSWGDVPMISEDAYNDYLKNRDNVLENIDETHKGSYYWVSFVAGDLNLEVRCPWSFIEFLNKNWLTIKENLNERLVISKSKTNYPADNWEPLQKNYTTFKAFIAELYRYGTFYLENIYGPDNLPEYTDKRKGKMVINRLVTSYTNELICLSPNDRFPNNISEEDFLENVLGQGDLEKGKAIYQMIYDAMLENKYK